MLFCGTILPPFWVYVGIRHKINVYWYTHMCTWSLLLPGAAPLSPAAWPGGHTWRRSSGDGCVASWAPTICGTCIVAGCCRGICCRRHTIYRLRNKILKQIVIVAVSDRYTHEFTATTNSSSLGTKGLCYKTRNTNEFCRQNVSFITQYLLKQYPKQVSFFLTNVMIKVYAM